MIWNMSRPDGVPKSRLSLMLINDTPSDSRSASAFTRWRHCCPAKAGCANSKRRAGNELSLFRACRDLNRRSGWFGRRGRQTMAHESGPHRLFAIDQLPSRPGVPPLRRTLSGDLRLRGFSCWDQYLAMAFAQLTYRESLRDIEACLRSMQGKLYHLGFRGKVARSTLADA